MKKEKSNFDRLFSLVEQFGNEKINSVAFKEYLSSEEPYFDLIKNNIANLCLYFNKFKTRDILKSLLVKYYRKIKQKRRRKETKKEKPIQQKSIIFLPFTETQVYFFEPIIKKLKTKNEKIITLRYDYSLEGIKKALKQKKLNYVTFEKYIDRDIERKSRKIQRRYRKVGTIVNNIIRKNLKYEKIRAPLFYYFGIRKKFFEIIEYIETIKKILEITKPVIIILPEDNSDTGKSTAYFCKKNNIPCLHIQHGLYGRDFAFTPPCYSTKIAVFGKATKQLFIKKRAKPSEIVITGSPIYDRFFKKINSRKKELIKKKLNLPKNKLLFLYVTQGQGLSKHKKHFEILFESMKKFSNAHLILYQHPSEHNILAFEKNFFDLAKKNKINITLNKKDLDDLLRVCDLFMTAWSTVAFGGMVNDKPVILLNPKKQKLEINFHEFGASLPAYNKEDLIKKINLCLNNKKIQQKLKVGGGKFIQKYLYKIDGKSTDRIVKLINQLKTKE